MHLITGYAGYEHIKSSDEGAFNAAFFGTKQYVMESGKKFAGSIINNNTVRILDGDGLMYGRHFRIEPDVYEDLTIETGTAGTNRIDLICATYEKKADDETELTYLQVVKGVETAGTAVAPEITNGNILEGASFNQMPLYKVTIEGVVLSEIEPLFETLLPFEPAISAIREQAATTLTAIEETVNTTLTEAEERVNTTLTDAEERVDETLTEAENRVNIALTLADERVDAAIDKLPAITKGTLPAGQTEAIIASTKITANSALSFYTSIYGVNPNTVAVGEGSVTLTFDAQEVDMEVGVRVDG